jgi:hypothetical protein
MSLCSKPRADPDCASAMVLGSGSDEVRALAALVAAALLAACCVTPVKRDDADAAERWQGHLLQARAHRVDEPAIEASVIRPPRTMTAGSSALA